jgi:uncharacterized protein YndB with AHSA1/START domain
MTEFAHDRELALDRFMAAPRLAIWRCWTEPELLTQWFTPAPWTPVSASLDVRPGGSTMIVMADPEGNEFPSQGVYLEVVPGQKLVFTDAYVRAWEPNEAPFMTAILTLADEGAGTRYRAVARHLSVEDRKPHEDMGFHAGWNAAADQLEALAARLT